VPRLRVVAVAARLPAWAEQACAEYARRMPRGYEIERISVKKIPQKREAWIALDERGQSMTTRQFAALLGSDATFIIGGADGLPDQVKQEARLVLKISSLTLPHALAQVVLLEQLYRAATILTGHPYHRT
jgi:23S rRNA (pseudouridine1915-N3)-methyltransferase